MNSYLFKIRKAFLFLLLLLLLVLLASPALSAEKVRFDHIEHITLDDGLSHSTVWDVHVDSRGFLWIATRSALHRYNGYDLETFFSHSQDPASLAASEVLEIYEDRRGILWFGHRSAGVSRFDPADETFARLNPRAEDPRSLTPGSVWTFHEDSLGDLWIGTRGGLNRLEENVDDPGQSAVTRIPVRSAGAPDPADDVGPGLNHHRVNALCEDRAGFLWVGTDLGLNRIRRDAAGAVLEIRHYGHDAEDPKSLSHPKVSALLQDRQGEIWIGTWDGTLQRYDATQDAFQRFPHPPGSPAAGRKLLALWESREGELLAATYYGLGIFDRKTGAYTYEQRRPEDPYGLSSNEIEDISEDRTGVLWLATRSGVSKINRPLDRIETYRRRPGRPDSLSGHRVVALAEDREGTLWVATPDGLSALDRARGKSTHFGVDGRASSGLPAESIGSLLVDREDTLWIGFQNSGLGRWIRDETKPSGRRYEAVPMPGNDSIAGFYQDDAGTLWAGTTELLRFDPESRRMVLFAKPEHSRKSFIYRIQVDRTGRLWLSTSNGLSYVDKPSRVLREIFHDPAAASGISPGPISGFFEDPEGVLWIGTAAGLNRWDRADGDPEKETWRRWGRAEGLANESIVGILNEGQEALWLATHGGLSRFDLRTETFRNYSTHDGLAGNVFYYGAALRSSTGAFAFGGEGGLSVLRPENLGEDLQYPPVVITRLQVEQEEVRPATELVLKHPQKTFSLEFAALHFIAPQGVRYAYRLEGYDEDWIETSADRRFARYTNLDAGEYLFRVRASRPSGMWNPEDESLKIRVVPPPWRTPWAYAFYALACGLLFLAYGRGQRKKIQRERRITDRERQINSRLREVDKLKDEFLANTSHELRTPLYGITGLAESLLEAEGRLPEDERREHLRAIVQSGHRLSHLVDDLLDFSKLRHDQLDLDLHPVELSALVDVVVTLLRPLVKKDAVRLESAVAADLPLVLADEHRVRQVLHNLVGNAIKFTPQGKIVVDAEQSDGWMVVSVADTGIGIAEDALDRIFDSFEQVDTSAERIYPGAGLGLAVSRQLVELHGGQFWVRSKPGKGSTFSLTLPLAESGSVGTEADSVGDGAERMQRANFAPENTEIVVRQGTDLSDGLRILVIDDESVVRQVLAGHLAGRGYRPLLAKNGEEGLALLGENPPDLVLLDVMMPQMSGYEVCREIRRTYSIEELPIIFLSAKSQSTDVMGGLVEGGNDYLIKPIARDELLARVEIHLALLQAHRRQSEEVETLRALLPICCVCKKIRDDQNAWIQIETYLSQHEEIDFSHGMCPTCHTTAQEQIDSQKALL